MGVTAEEGGRGRSTLSIQRNLVRGARTRKTARNSLENSQTQLWLGSPKVGQYYLNGFQPAFARDVLTTARANVLKTFPSRHGFERDRHLNTDILEGQTPAAGPHGMSDILADGVVLVWYGSLLP
jgi:hypothetical protein